MLVPILALWLLSQVAWPAIPRPDIDLPRIHWPDIPWPDIPWPDIQLPALPWPDLPDLPDLPPWVRDASKLIGPILIAFLIARGEVRRRREHDARKKEERESAGHGNSD